MLRPVVIRLILAVIVIAGVVFALSRIDSAKPLKRVEKIVPDNALAK